ncbi:hypothetical protein [Marinobacter sp. SS5-14b]|uniref:hypothetical protein n=1 Tax=Marinobacter sp. SS5-14b TaxID=3050456 RepID=UPI0026E00B59|nr:hypothetical protein [Marinobacter sp. SS5-14b]
MEHFEKWLVIANSGILASLVGLLITVLLAYPLAGALSLSVQIAAHMGTLFFAVGVKIAYVARLTFLSKLGRPVH